MMKLLALVSLAALNAALVSAECCTKSSWGQCVMFDQGDCVSWICRDGTYVGITECCGFGRCNVFCCNCDKRSDGKVCRVASRRALLTREPVDEMVSSEEIAAADADMFNAADTNNNGELSLAEFLAYGGATEEDKDLVVKFNTFDKDGNRVLTVNEMRLEA